MTQNYDKFGAMQIFKQKVFNLIGFIPELLGAGKWKSSMLCCLIYCLTSSCGFSVLAQPAFRPRDLHCEHLKDPIGIDAPTPRLSWKTDAPGCYNWVQGGYQIQVATDTTFAARQLCWDSGKVPSDVSLLVPYQGKSLTARTRYYWRVRVWDAGGLVSPWSPVAFWETGLLGSSGWRAQWIAVRGDTLSEETPAPLLRRSFVVNAKLRSARLYVTARGLYEMHLNGQKVGNALLTPGWTVYPKRLQYQTYDVTTLLQRGENILGALLGEGWYRGGLGSRPTRAIYGKKLGLLCQLCLQYQDGRIAWINSDGEWRATRAGPIRYNDPYNGEHYDARQEQEGWDRPGFDAGHWQAVEIPGWPLDNIYAQTAPPVRALQEINPLSIVKTPDGVWVADMGQNLVGRVRLRVQGPAGTRVVLRHAEVLDKKGNFYTENLRKARQRIEYTLKGGGMETYEPRFTWMGFRYVAIEGYPGTLSPESLTAVVMYSDLQTTGDFNCSNKQLNRLQENIVWGQRGNFVDIPTDCPQRDERLGWTGDAQVFAPTAAYNMDVAAFFDKWLLDLTAEQHPDGAVPWTAPNILDPPGAAALRVSAGWSDAAVILPWTLYRLYGDQQLLRRQYPSMRAWVEYMRKKATPDLLYLNGSVFGDWFFFRPAPRQTAEPDAYTDRDFISTAFFAHSVDLLSRSARVLGEKEDAAQYAGLFEQIKKSFLYHYMTPAGRTVSHTQTSYVLPLAFGLLPDSMRLKSVAYLKADILRQKKHLTTGFLGTPYLCDVLTEYGEQDLAFELLFQETYPSWLYPVKMGATTIWERWDGIRPDSTFQDPYVNSFNHYAYGAIGDWMYRNIGGIRALEPGYKRIEIAPVMPAQLTYASATHDSPYGLIAVNWQKEGDSVFMRVVIPPNTGARLRLPIAGWGGLAVNGQPAAHSGLLLQAESGAVYTEIGSGARVFTWKIHE